jgi:tungstate transport system permease protein
MDEFTQAFASAMRLVYTLDPSLLEVVGLSLGVSLAAVAIATIVGLPLGAAIALFRFPGSTGLVVLINALMGLPPVVVGLAVYLLLSRSGPLGVFGLLYTPAAMIIAQTVLVTPIIAALSRQTIEELWAEYADQLRSFGADRRSAIPTLLWDARSQLGTSVLAGFGRASAEVGAVIIVGGNIDHLTRVMTTAIALETSRGDLGLALGLGFLLVLLSVVVNATVFLVNEGTAPRHSAV